MNNRYSIFNTVIPPEKKSSKPVSIRTSPQFICGVKRAKYLARTGEIFSLKKGIYKGYRFKIRSFNVLVYLDSFGCILHERQFSSIEDLTEELYWMSFPLKRRNHNKKHRYHHKSTQEDK